MTYIDGWELRLPFEKINNRGGFLQSEVIKEVRFLILRFNHNCIIH